MERFLEIILGFLFGVRLEPSAAGVERSVGFNPPHWMSWWHLSPRIVNAFLVVAIVALVVLIYRRDGRRTGPRIGLGILRALVLAYVLVLINRPIIVVTESRTEPSVLAILVDDTVSMSVRDMNRDGTPTSRPSGAAPAAIGPTTGPADASSSQPTRLETVIDVLSGEDQALLRKLAAVHTLRFYAFDRDAHPLGSTAGAADKNPAENNSADKSAEPEGSKGTAAKAGGGAKDAAKDKTPKVHIDPKLVDAIRGLKPEGRSTQIIPSLLTVLDDLQGQRLAGVVLITDARETPTASPAALTDRLNKYPVKIYPVPVGSDQPPTNVEMVSLSVQDSAFAGDIIAAKVQVRGTGFEPGKSVRVRLMDKAKHVELRSPDGSPAEKVVVLPEAQTVEQEIIFKPEGVGPLQVEAVAELQQGEIDPNDNVKDADVAVLDAKINVLYVDGYPRWEYRYIKNEMIRDKTVNISCLLTSADQLFAQEGDPPEPYYGEGDPRNGEKFPGPITRFPEKMEELMKYDVVLFGDVDPRLFDDRQKQMVSDFVNKNGGGFGMIAGPRFSPYEYRNTPIEAVLPVNISHVLPDDPTAEYRDGFRPVVTDEGRRGEASTIFRFFPDKAVNDKYLRDDLQPVFWYCRGVSAKPNVGLVYAEHPYDSDPNTGRKAPILVLGRFGAGRTLFSAIDDSWRWRYYTGESVFDTYWVQQLRYLARSKKLGQRKVRFNGSRNTYELGEPVTLELKVLDPILLPQLPPELRVEVVDDATGQTVRQETLQKQEASPDIYTGTFTADRVGKFHVKPPGQPAALAEAMRETQAVEVTVINPRLELSEPQVDRQMLSRLAPAARIVPLAQARVKLPEIIQSAAVTTQVGSTEPLWNTWRALGIFVLLLTTEWVLRKAFGMI